MFKRHGSHHRANVKYGYLVLAVSIVYAAFLLVLRSYLRSLRRVSLIFHMAFWVLLFAGLSANVHDLIENYTVLLKRTGRLAFCLVPLDILLALRPPVLGTLYIEDVPLHKWLLRLIIAGSAVHGVGFFVRWAFLQQLRKKLANVANLCGIAVFVAAAALAVISLRPLRVKNYKVFYVVHNATVLLFSTLIAFHARPGVTDVSVLVLVLLCFQIYGRFQLVSATFSVHDDERSLLAVLEFSSLFPPWLPGSHIRVAPLGLALWIWPLHPYTLCLLPEDDSAKLVVKKGKFSVVPYVNYSVSAPFAPQELPKMDQVQILCGGLGISFGVPIFRFLRGQGVAAKLHWCVRSRQDVYVLSHVLNEEIDIYITGTEFSQNVELEELTETKQRIHNGRPNLDEALAFEDVDEKCVVTCGPTSLVKSVKAWGRANSINVYSEKYAF